MKKINIENIKKVYTHNGVFHADEVMSIALLRNLGCEAEIKRVREVPEIIEDDTIVLDIGGVWDGVKYFDHHRKNKDDIPCRPNGVKYATFGILVKELGICSQEGFESFDSLFACGIDARDNGQFEMLGEYPSPVGDTVKLMNPNWDSSKTSNECFEEAVQFAQTVLKNEFERRLSIVSAKSILQKAVDTAVGGIMLLEPFVPWKDFVIQNGYNIKGAVSFSRGDWVINSLDSKRWAFPEKWVGENPILPAGVKTVHPARFLAACESKERALEVAQEYLLPVG